MLEAFLAGLMALPPAAPVVGARLAASDEARFMGYASAWSRTGAGLPVPIATNSPVDAVLKLPAVPGQAATRTRMASFPGGLDATLRFFAVCPHGAGAGTPCPGLYYQVQVQLSGAAEAFCSSSLNGDDALPFPVLQCAGPSKSDPSRWLGVTLHRSPL